MKIVMFYEMAPSAPSQLKNAAFIYPLGLRPRMGLGEDFLRGADAARERAADRS
jgi:hypothetical protein